MGAGRTQLCEPTTFMVYHTITTFRTDRTRCKVGVRIEDPKLPIQFRNSWQQRYSLGISVRSDDSREDIDSKIVDCATSEAWHNFNIIILSKSFQVITSPDICPQDVTPVAASSFPAPDSSDLCWPVRSLRTEMIHQPSDNLLITPLCPPHIFQCLAGDFSIAHV